MLELQPFTSDDFEQLIAWVKDDHLLMNWSGSLFNFPLTQKSLEWYVENANDIENSDVFIYKAVDTDTGKTIGHISLGSLSKKNRSARISRVLIGDSDNRGKGCCQSIIKAVLEIGFQQLKLHRIDLGVYSFNTSAINCYKKCGFSIEGTGRDVLLFKGEWWSLIEMGILEDEWRNNKLSSNESI